MTAGGKRPNLFIIGAMKSGTTSLHYALSKHPVIYMSETKEPGYFVKELNWERGENWYMNLFSGADSETYIGESSTHYAKLPNFKGVNDRIYKFNKNAKIIYVMRNPVDRAISHYWHNIHLSSLHIDKRFIPEKRNILKALEEDPDFINFGYYAMQLKPYFEVFGINQIFVTTFEKLVNESIEVMKELYEWLGLSSGQVPPDLPAENIRGSEITQISGKGILHRIRHSEKFGFLSPYAPSRIKNILKKYSVKKVTKNEEELNNARSYLIKHQRAQVTELENLLNRRMSEWKDFY